jgi:hypothetical protein
VTLHLVNAFLATELDFHSQFQDVRIQQTPVCLTVFYGSLIEKDIRFIKSDLGPDNELLAFKAPFGALDKSANKKILKNFKFRILC